MGFIQCLGQESERLLPRAGEDDKLLEENFKERRQDCAKENGVRHEDEIERTHARVSIS